MARPTGNRDMNAAIADLAALGWEVRRTRSHIVIFNPAAPQAERITTSTGSSVCVDQVKRARMWAKRMRERREA